MLTYDSNKKHKCKIHFTLLKIGDMTSCFSFKQRKQKDRTTLHFSDFSLNTHHLCIRSTLFLMVCYKALLLCIQTQENVAFLTFPSRHTLWTQVAPPTLVTVKRPMSTIVVTHIWLWGSWGVAFLLRWWRAGRGAANFGCWLVESHQTVGNCQAESFERHWFLIQ